MQSTLFPLDSYKSYKWYIFKNSSELGKIYDAIPWTDLVQLLPEKESPKGAPAWLKPQGYIGMMFLKHYYKVSDEKLLELFHANTDMQLFCGCLLQENEKIKNNAFVSHVRSYLAKNLNSNDFQKIMISYWKASNDLENTHLLMLDATCFESYIRFPTDVKLLFECCEKIHEKLIPSFCKKYNLKLPRTAFKAKRNKYLAYSKNRKKSHRKTLQIRQNLLKFLKKSINLYTDTVSQVQGYEIETKLGIVFSSIQKVLEQQKILIEDPKNKVDDRIVSIFKPYVRPIKRGKENKPTEFGMKAHICQTDGINWLEHVSFSAFNENTRLESSVLSCQEMFGKCSQLAADNIYPTNKNRKFLTDNDIETNFPKKGPKESDPVKLRKEKKIKEKLGKLRSTALEGSFGNEKNHYLLNKIKAQNEGTELIWVLFGVFTANVVLIKNKRKAKIAKEKAEKEMKLSRKKAA